MNRVSLQGCVYRYRCSRSSPRPHRWSSRTHYVIARCRDLSAVSVRAEDEGHEAVGAVVGGSDDLPDYGVVTHTGTSSTACYFYRWSQASGSYHPSTAIFPATRGPIAQALQLAPPSVERDRPSRSRSHRRRWSGSDDAAGREDVAVLGHRYRVHPAPKAAQRYRSRRYCWCPRCWSTAAASPPTRASPPRWSAAAPALAPATWQTAPLSQGCAQWCRRAAVLSSWLNQTNGCPLFLLRNSA